MSVLDPRELQASPLADLHTLAGELGLEGFRRLRKDDLIRQIVEAQGGTMPEAAEPAQPAEEPDADEQGDDDPPFVDADPTDGPSANGDVEAEAEPEPEPEREPEPQREEEVRTGILDVLPNGSGFI